MIKFAWKTLKRQTIVIPLFALTHPQSTGSYHVLWFPPRHFHGLSTIFSSRVFADGANLGLG